jgi:hypothetical protein
MAPAPAVLRACAAFASQLGSHDRDDAALLDEAQQVIPCIIIEHGRRERRGRNGAHGRIRGYSITGLGRRFL